ncbi:hypothetical protein IV203_030724 [Nitzschia inconspicua]|uniref:Uncharacterized protein n=1 Tax=Nitzschia inconspicua TaxID=303405 RepID=A0A9K3LWJ8_9STRA|nr:hypothetical protein IV203_030724 [Nitzschia inconspicua]
MNPVMNPMQPLEQLNNEGTILLEQGRFEEAIETLALALNAAKKNAAEQEPVNDESNELRRPAPTGHRKQMVILMPPLPAHHFLSSPSEIQANVEGLCFCFVKLSEEDCFSDHNVTAVVESSTAILYNLALAYHLHATFGVCTVSGRSFSRHRAKTLYEMAY